MIPLGESLVRPNSGIATFDLQAVNIYGSPLRGSTANSLLLLSENIWVMSRDIIQFSFLGETSLCLLLTIERLELCALVYPYQRWVPGNLILFCMFLC